MKWFQTGVAAGLVWLTCLAVGMAEPIAYGCWNGTYLSLDLATGEATAIDSSPGYYALDYGPDGTLYAASRSADKLYRFTDPASGQVEYLADMAGDYHGLNMAVSPDGNSIYYSLGWSFYRYDIPGDATVPMGTLSEYLVSIDFGPDGLLYGIGEQWQLCTLDLDTLNATSVGPAYLGLKIDGLVRCLEFAPDGTLYASVDPTEYEPGDPPDEYVCTLDPATGLGTMHWSAQIYLGSDPFRTDTLAIPVPEPCTLVLLSLGAVGLGGYAWRKRRRW